MKARRRVSAIVFLGVGAALGAAALHAQTAPQPGNELREILDRLTRLEQDNRDLKDEIRALRTELATARQTGSAGVATQDQAAAAATSTAAAGASTPMSASPAPMADQVAVDTARIDEMAQTKVESSQKLPIRISGMALFNAYLNSKYNGGTVNTVTASLPPGDAPGGATLQQTIFGLQFESPKSVLGAKVTGSVFADFFGGTGNSLDHMLRLRTATVALDWGSTSIIVGQDKPLISPRDPNSFAQVGVSPLTGAGNLWLWQPEARIEQRFKFSSSSGLIAQLGMFQTREIGAEESGYNPYFPPPTTAVPVEHPDPGLEGRFEFWHQFGENSRIEIAPGFHENQSHLGSTNIPSHIFSIDWLVKPASFLEFSGFFYDGQNIASLGALPQGFIVTANGVRVVHSTGGWAQMRIPVTQRLAFDFYGGTQDDRNTDLAYGYIGANRAYFGNAQYRIAPNVILSLEGGQVRTTYLGIANRLNNHYDLALAYLF